MKYYFIAGEASGDLHASNLIKELKKKDKSSQFEGLGGEMMEAAGMNLIRHYKEMAFMGFIPVLMNLRKIHSNFKICKESILKFKPDVLILVDYPSFNLKMAAFAKSLGIKVFYYISPKVWIWKKKRVNKMKLLIDEMFTIFPFETDFYKQHGLDVNYIGNPIMDAVLSKKTKHDNASFCLDNKPNTKPILALLPGSRLQEIRSLLPIMLEASKEIYSHQVIVTAAPNVPKEIYDKYCINYDVQIAQDQTYKTIQIADVALVASGTATLETAILKCPQVVCYKMGGGAPLYYIGKWFVGITFVSLVNIILKKMAVPELLQHRCNADNIREELKKIIENPVVREGILKDYIDLSLLLGGGGASAKAAEIMIGKLNFRTN